MILMGLEGPRLMSTIPRLSDERVRVSLLRGTDSLNVATAAVVFYERGRSD